MSRWAWLGVLWPVRYWLSHVARSGAIQALAQLLEDEECQLLSVSVEDSHLKELTVVLLNALAENNSLTAINLT